jgi:hypothetical protein
MLFNRDSAIQKYFRRFCTVARQRSQFSTSRPDDVSSRPDDVTYHPDARQTKASSVKMTWISVRTLICIEKLLFQLASVQTTLSDRASDFLSKSKYGKIAATVRTTWIPIRTRYFLRQVRNSNSIVRTLVCHCPDARPSDM